MPFRQIIEDMFPGRRIPPPRKPTPPKVVLLRDGRTKPSLPPIVVIREDQTEPRSKTVWDDLGEESGLTFLGFLGCLVFAIVAWLAGWILAGI